MVTFVDTNVWMLAIGRDHPLRKPARTAISVNVASGPFVVSTDVLQEVLHVYLRQGDRTKLDAAITLIQSTATIWTIEMDDILTARDLSLRFPSLDGRDLVHLALCIRHDVDELITFDRALATAWDHR